MSDKQVVPIQQQPRPALVAGGAGGAIVPRDIEQAFRLATAIAHAGMAPKSYANDANKIMVGILHGMEVGLTPMAALQSIAVINGMPSVWGDGALALVRGSGLLEGISETVEGEGDAMTAVCVLRRKGEREPIVGRFSIANAKKAKLHGKAGPWQEYPERMLKMRARSFAIRDGFADVLRGLHVAEEARDMGGLAEQGDGSYAASARPKRSDYQAEHPGLTPEAGEAATDEPADKFALFDHTGETVGAYEPDAFLEEFFAAIGDAKVDRAQRAQILRNNMDTASNLWLEKHGKSHGFWAELGRLKFTNDDYSEPKESAGASEPPSTPAGGEAGAADNGSPAAAPAERVGFPLYSTKGAVLTTSDTPDRYLGGLESTINGTIDEGDDPQPFWNANRATLDLVRQAGDPALLKRIEALQARVLGKGGKQGRMV